MKPLVGLLLGLLLAPLGLASEHDKSLHSAWFSKHNVGGAEISPPVLLAQVTGCPRATVIAVYETRNFNVHICQGLNNYVFYRGVSKSDGSGINLDVAKDAQGSWIARNGKVVYKVNFTELLVTDNGRVILRERVISPP